MENSNNSCESPSRLSADSSPPACFKKGQITIREFIQTKKIKSVHLAEEAGVEPTF